MGAREDARTSSDGAKLHRTHRGLLDVDDLSAHSTLHLYRYSSKASNEAHWSSTEGTWEIYGTLHVQAMVLICRTERPQGQ